MSHGRFLANVFHDVNLAATWPTCYVDIVPEHPECRPHSLPERQFDASLETAVGLAEFSKRLQPSGGVVSGFRIRFRILLVQGSDDEIAISQKDVGRAVGIILEFLVAPTLTPGFENPLGTIHGRPIRTIELIAPNQFPALVF